MQLHSADAIHLPAGMPPVQGQAEVRALMKHSLAALPPGMSFAFSPAAVRLDGALAVEWGTTPSAGPFPGGKYIMVCQQDPDRSWRITWTITNQDGAPG
jgi:hypothetical protein